jgi:primosomal replication protein N
MHLNSCTMIGRVSAKGAALRYTESGAPFCSFVLEVDELSQGKVYTTWIPIEITGKHAEQTSVDLEVGIEVTFEDDRQTVFIKMQRGLLVMPRSVFDEARKRGEKYAQETSLNARTTPVPYAEFHQAPQEVKHPSGNGTVCETFPNRKQVTPSAKARVMAACLTIELPAAEISSGGSVAWSC